MNFFKNTNREDFKELMAFMTVGLSFIYMFAVTFFELPEENQRFADIILGSLLTIVIGNVLSHYFDPTQKATEENKENYDDIP